MFSIRNTFTSSFVLINNVLIKDDILEIREREKEREREREREIE